MRENVENIMTHALHEHLDQVTKSAFLLLPRTKFFEEESYNNDIPWTCVSSKKASFTFVDMIQTKK